MAPDATRSAASRTELPRLLLQRGKHREVFCLQEGLQTQSVMSVALLACTQLHDNDRDKLNTGDRQLSGCIHTTIPVILLNLTSKDGDDGNDENAADLGETTMVDNTPAENDIANPANDGTMFQM